MRKRKVQREMKRVCEKEEKIDLYDCCGIKDPTPYEAVSNLVKQERKADVTVNKISYTNA